MSRTIIWVSAIVMAAGCAHPPRVQEMVPRDPGALVGAGQLAVSEVTGGRETHSWDLPHLSDAEFHEALVTTLRQRGLLDQSATRRLRARIVSERSGNHPWANTILLRVFYESDDPADPVWHWTATIESEASLNVTQVYDGRERLRRMLELAARRNIADLLSRLGPELVRRASAP